MCVCSWLHAFQARACYDKRQGRNRKWPSHLQVNSVRPLYFCGHQSFQKMSNILYFFLAVSLFYCFMFCQFALLWISKGHPLRMNAWCLTPVSHLYEIYVTSSIYYYINVRIGADISNPPPPPHPFNPFLAYALYGWPLRWLKRGAWSLFDE